MSGNAFKRAGICSLEENPTVGVLDVVTPNSYRETKKKLDLVLKQFSNSVYWTAGASGTWNVEHPYYRETPEKLTSNDIDVWIDAQDATNTLSLEQNSTPAAVRSHIADLLEHFYCVSQSGNIVHLAFPAGYEVYSFAQGKNLPAFFQVDIVIANNAAEIIKHHEHEYTSNSRYSGYEKISAISSLVNSVPGYPSRTFKYSAFQGAVINRTTEQVVASDLNEVARLILGKKYSAKDLRSVESIVKIVGLNSERLNQFRKEFAAQAK